MKRSKLTTQWLRWELGENPDRRRQSGTEPAAGRNQEAVALMVRDRMLPVLSGDTGEAVQRQVLQSRHERGDCDWSCI